MEGALPWDAQRKGVFLKHQGAWFSTANLTVASYSMITDLSDRGTTSSLAPGSRATKEPGVCLWVPSGGQELLPMWEALCGHSTRVPRERQCRVVFVFNAWILLASLLF